MFKPPLGSYNNILPIFFKITNIFLHSVLNISHMLWPLKCWLFFHYIFKVANFINEGHRFLYYFIFLLLFSWPLLMNILCSTDCHFFPWVFVSHFVFFCFHVKHTNRKMFDPFSRQTLFFSVKYSLLAICVSFFVSGCVCVCYLSINSFFFHYC